MTHVLNGARPTAVPAELLFLDDADLLAEDTGTPDDKPERPRTKRTNPLSTLAADLRGAWFTVAEPPSLMAWLAGPTTAVTRVPDGNPWLRWLWTADNWTTGLLFLALSTVGFGVAATGRWVACHPARRWAFLFLTAVTCTYLWLA